jgi:hypothetical protein
MQRIKQSIYFMKPNLLFLALALALGLFLNSCKNSSTNPASTASIKVLTPRNGDTIYAGTQYTITFSTADSGTNHIINYQIDYSIDDGATWVFVGVTTGNTYPYYQWLVPNTPSEKVIIRITDEDGSVGKSGIFKILTGKDIVFPAMHVSFRAQVELLFAASCNTSGCHGMAAPSNNDVDLTSWIGVRATNVVNQPGDTTCGLLQVVFGREFHNGPINLNENQRQGLKQWVIEGAQNN